MDESGRSGDPTQIFKLGNELDNEIRRTVTVVAEALVEKGYNPENQIVGYILSEDPTYITTHKNARALLGRIDRDDMLRAMVRAFIDYRG